MFDVGFSELLIIGVVALLVLGPERLPHAARFAGLWVRRARTHWASVRAELERELEVERVRADLDAASASVQEPMQELESSLRAAQAELDGMARQSTDPLMSHASPESPPSQEDSAPDPRAPP